MSYDDVLHGDVFVFFLLYDMYDDDMYDDDCGTCFHLLALAL